MPAPLVRPAAARDADAIGQLHVRSWRSAYRGTIPQDYLDGLDPAARSRVWRRILEEDAPSRGGTLVAVAEGGGITGFASFGPSRDGDADPQVTGEVFAIYADPAAWGQGPGVLSWAARSRNWPGSATPTQPCGVLDANERARRFYALAGWAEDGETKTDGGRGFDITEVRYRRTLSERA